MSGLEAAAIAALAKVSTASGALYTAAQHEVTYEAAVKLVKTLETFGSTELMHPDCVDALETMDIKASVSTIEAIIDDLRLMASGNTSKSIQVCMKNLHDTVTKIEILLNKIDNKCNEWKQSWWSWAYTYPDCTSEIASLQRLKTVMDNRIELLTRSVTLELQMKALQKDEKHDKHDKSENDTKQP